MSVPKNVIVIGAGGNLGPCIVEALHAAGNFNISVLSRPGSNSTFPLYVRVIKSDYEERNLAKAFERQDAVVSVVASAAIADQKKFIDAAVEAGVKRFLPSEYGCNTQNPKTLDMVPILKGKLAILDYLKEKASGEKDFTWSTIINGPFFDFGLKFGFLGFDFATKTATIYDGGTTPFSSAKLSTIGKAVASVLSRPVETANKILYIASHTVTQNDILSVAEKVTGGKWTISEVTTAEVRKTAQEKIAKGDFSGYSTLMLTATYMKGLCSDFEKNEELANGLLKLEKDDLLEDVRAIIS